MIWYGTNWLPHDSDCFLRVLRFPPPVKLTFHHHHHLDMTLMPAAVATALSPIGSGSVSYSVGVDNEIALGVINTRTRTA